MIRRHPHVFGKTRARDSAEVLRNWEQIKAEERRASGKKKAIRMAVEKHQKKLLCSMASLTHCPQRWKAFSSLAKLPELVLTGTTQGGFFEKNAGRIGRVEEGLGRARPAENRRGAGRLALRRRKPLTIFEDRPGNRPQEGQREILSPIPRHGGAGPEKMAGSSKTCRAKRWRHFGTPGRSRKGSRALPEKKLSGNEAMSQAIIVRKCESLNDFHRCVHLQREVWGEADLEVEPATMFCGRRAYRR